MPKQSWDPEAYARNARFVADLGMPVVELLAPQPGERILDLGCGDGALTETLAALGCHVVGIDTSPAQIAAARSRGLEAYVIDGQALPFAGEFDAVFSNAALHWMPRPDDVIAGVWQALVPGGRFVGECGGQGNIAHIHSALYEALSRRGIEPSQHDPWYYPAPDEYGGLLQAHGFVVEFMDLFSRPTPLPGDITGWLETFAQCFIEAVGREARSDLMAELRSELLPHLYDGHGQWIVDYVRLRFAARKPANGK